ncbi:MAG: adenine deaminase [Chloroflexota bacterium]|nr:adenine deaminase [Chloroflexota bacterium]
MTLDTAPNADAATRWRRRLAVAQGREPADIVVAGGQVLDVFTEELFPAEVAIVDGVIAGVGRYDAALSRIDASGTVVAPSFIDAHVHLESSLLWLPEYARVVVPHGTGAVVTDPHEIANVRGLIGVAAMRQAAQGLPLRVAFTAPSCVPASEHESPGADFGVAEIATMLSWSETVGLGEMMDFSGVLAGSDGVAAKLAASGGRRRDGHAPKLSGATLQAYVGSGMGSDHESTELQEAREKLRAGLMLMLREGSSEKNVRDLLPLVTDATYPRCCFASDDRDPHDLLHKGHLDDVLRTVIAAGLNPLRAIRMATWNAAAYWRLDGLGAVAPGYEANLVLLGDLDQIRVRATLYQGNLVAKDGACVASLPDASPPEALKHTVNLAPLLRSALRMSATDEMPAVGVIPGQIVTRHLTVAPSVDGDEAVVDTARDLLKLVCVERHRATGRVGTGYVTGFGLRRGALASSIAHDAHNILAVGANDSDLLSAIAAIADSGGGLAAVADGKLLAHLPLPVAGLLSDRPAREVAETYGRLEEVGRELGSPLASPFGQLAFLALSVIPEARVTDRGFLHVGS